MSLTFVERNAAQHGPTYVAAFEAVVIRDGEPLAFYTEESLHLAKEHFLSAAAWCEENLGDYWYDTKPNHETILFYTLREAAAFKLRWG